ncbi:MAG: hypothetical protein OI717_00435 (plasmid) [Candidatus Methanoperedens sp.]|nr:MAG: hypothetical protein OI717_00435 [Candidatus Methanoperedens sp.]
MVKLDVETLLKGESPYETLKRTYAYDGREVQISFKKGMVQPGEYYLVERVGKNIRLTLTKPYLVASHPEDPRHRKIRTAAKHPAVISFPQDYAKPDQLFRVIKSKVTGIIWLLRIDSFYYADVASIPLDVLKAV